MKNRIRLLDCTLRDGAYITESYFGTPTMRGIIKRLQDAKVDIVECGWLKDTPHKEGTSYFHVPSDLESYLLERRDDVTYVVMIDWDRYDLSQLPPYDGKSIDAIRVVFPQQKFREGIALGKTIKEKGYKVYFQAANTLGYSDEELIALSEEINRAQPVALSVVDTFGAMYIEDLEHIVRILDHHLDSSIGLGFHSHNNQQLSFSLSAEFIKLLEKSDRNMVVDSSLCGMGRGAGNTTTELLVSYLIRKYQGNYDLNVIMDAIDLYMQDLQMNYSWGYSTPYFISGLYCAHVNNIAYLLKNHRCSAKDMRSVIESLSPADRKKYDYCLLEQKYVDYQNKVVNDEKTIQTLMEKLGGREILLLFPGKSIVTYTKKINEYIDKNHPVVIGINAVPKGYNCDVLFFSTGMRYAYAAEVAAEQLANTSVILTSNIKTEAKENEFVVNFNMLVKRGWQHFDNSGIMCLRLLNRLRVKQVSFAGFDGFSDEYAESYADVDLPPISPGKEWCELNDEISEMLSNFRETTAGQMMLTFITPSIYECDKKRTGGIGRNESEDF